MKQQPKSTSTRVAVGLWGGPHARLQVTDEGGQIQYDCGSGRLTEPLKLDAQGRFSVTGIHVRERPGPVRVNAKPDEHPARYRGSVRGQTLTLNVTTTDDGEDLGTFTLTHGSEAQLTRCY
ncbi:MAG TPA: hypothetical protein VF525_16875 [Pyrinomonadaceae bacterium]